MLLGIIKCNGTCRITYLRRNGYLVPSITCPQKNLYQVVSSFLECCFHFLQCQFHYKSKYDKLLWKRFRNIHLQHEILLYCFMTILAEVNHSTHLLWPKYMNIGIDILFLLDDYFICLKMAVTSSVTKHVGNIYHDFVLFCIVLFGMLLFPNSVIARVSNYHRNLIAKQAKPR